MIGRILDLLPKLLYAVIALALTLVTLVVVALSTESGSRMTVSLAERFAPGELSVDQVDGILLRDFSLRDVRYANDEGVVLEIELVEFRWRPWQLLRQHAHIRALRLDTVTLTLPESEPSETPLFPIELPDIALPWDIRVDQLIVYSATVQDASQEPLVSLQRMQFRGRYHEGHLRIGALSATTPELHLQLHGELTTYDHYEVALNSLVRLPIDELGEVTLTGEFHGNIGESLRFRQEAHGGVNALLQGSAQSLLTGDLAWSMDLQVDGIAHPEVEQQVSEFVLQFQGEGGLDHAEGLLMVTALSHDHGLITLEARGRFSEQRAQLSEFSIRASEYGLFTRVTGTGDIRPDELNVRMDGIFELADYPELTLDLLYEGNFTSVQNLDIRLNADEGSIQITGNADWQDTPRWDIEALLENLDSTRFLPEYPSQLNGKLSSRGEWGENPDVRVILERLTGDLLGYPLSASGDLHLQNESLAINQFNLESGTSRVSARGTLGADSLDVQAQISAPELNALHPDAAGTLNAELHLRGSQSRPQIQLKAQGADIRWQEYRVATLDTELEIDTQLNQLPTGFLRLTQIFINEELEPLDLDLRLSQNAHHEVRLSISGETLDVENHLRGHWSDGAWEGQIQQFEASYEGLGRWFLESPIDVHAAENELRIAPFCLVVSTRDARFCSEVLWRPDLDEITVRVNADQLSFDLLRPWLPEQVQVYGSVDLNLEYIQRGDERNYDGRVHLYETRFSLPEQDVELWLTEGDILEFRGNSEQLDARVRIQTETVGGDIQGVAAITQPFDAPELTAELALDFTDLTVISLFTPELQNIEGSLSGRITALGSLARPEIAGSIELEGAGAEVPAAGIQLRNLAVTLSSPDQVGGPFLLSGNVESGEGAMNLEGTYQLDTHTAQVRFQGQNFTAMQTREIQLAISPNLTIDMSPELLRVRGEVTIPRALVSPPDFETIELSSNDTIVVRGDETVWEQSRSNPYDIDVQVNLGDNFQVSAFGFDGRLTGRLRVIETPGQDTTGVGNINVVAGRYEIYGQALDIDRGTLVFTGGPIDNPGLDLRVTRNIDMEMVTVGARIGGTLQEPNLALFSTPTMQDAEILSYLVLGRGFGQENTEEENMLLRASLLLGMQGGNILGQRLSDRLGVDEIMLDGGDTLESTALYIGKHLSSRLYVKYGVGLIEPVNTFFIRYRLTDFLSFETQTGNQGAGADLFYTIERD
ncbi:MAG: translocation/assembly module TamB domain-containing protein [Idiomarina sp.]|nr:translocation/assembly module TamB domain-containing protein [Idiomarina sp.]